MSSGRLWAGALVFVAHLAFAPLSFADSGPDAIVRASQAAQDLGAGGHLSPAALVALLAAGFVPAIIKFARERKGRDSE